MNLELKTSKKKFLVLSSWFKVNRGFTLIELLAVIALIGLIGTITSQFFILGFRSQGRSEVGKEIKQNGDYALAVMESMIRNAAYIPDNQCYGVNPSSRSVVIVNPDGYETTFDCSGTEIASNSSSTNPNSYPLTNDKVTIADCIIRVICPTPPINPMYVYINFTFNQAGPNITLSPGSSPLLEYQTTVSLRNYQ